MRISFGFAALIIVLNTLPSGAEPGKSQSQTQVQRQAATGTKPNNQNAHFLREGEVGYGTRLLKVPDNYPLPVPPGATQGLSESVVGDKGNNGFYLRLHSPHTRSELIDWYLVQLKNSGWKVEQPLPNGKGMAVTGTKPGGGGAVIIFYNSPKGGTEITTNGTL